MKILIATTSSNNVFTVIDSLRYLNQHDITVFHYDEKWNRECQTAIQANPDVKNLLQQGLWPPPENRDAWRRRVEMDSDLLRIARDLKPDVAFYISAWEGLFVPSHETLGELNSVVPLVHFCFDAADKPWWSQMKEFEQKGLFSLTTTIDGAIYWPGHQTWNGDWKIKNALTLLTPCDPRYFQGVDIPFSARPYAVAYGGNAGGWIRSHLVRQLVQHKSHVFTYRARDDFSNSYKLYAEFLRHSKCVVSVPFTGSNYTTHVKGRPVEAGWAGTALLEWRNAATRAWFIPRWEFWEYESVESCAEEVEYVAHHPELCEEMARNLHYRISKEHNPARIWGSIFDKLEEIKTA